MTKNSNAFMPLYVGDYLADTTMLTRDQHGAYLLLIMAYWRNRGPLPDRDDALAMASRSTPQEWKKLRPILQTYFVVKDGVWFHKRISEELVKADEKYAARVEASRKANGVRHGHRDGASNGHRDGSQPHLLTSLRKVSKGKRAAAQSQPAAPPVSDWADEIPQWSAFKSKLPASEWQAWFATSHPNGAITTLVAPSQFAAEQVAARYGSKLEAHFGEAFQIKTKGGTQ
jgi:hypothetical protein